MRWPLMPCAILLVLISTVAHARQDRTFEWLQSLAVTPPTGSGTLLGHWFAACESQEGAAKARCEGRREVIQGETRGQIYLAYSPLGSLSYGEYRERKKLFRVEWTGDLGDVPFDAPAECTPLDQVSSEQASFPYWSRLATPRSDFFCGADDEEEASVVSAELAAAYKRIDGGHLALVQGKARRWLTLRGRHFSVRVGDAGQAERLIEQGSLAVQSVIRVLHPLDGWAKCCGGKPSPLKRKQSAGGDLVHVEGLKVQVLAFRLIDLSSGAIYYSKPKSTSEVAHLVEGTPTEPDGEPLVAERDGEGEEGAVGATEGERSVTRPVRLLEAPPLSMPPDTDEPRRPITVVVDVVVGVEGDVEEVSVRKGPGEPWNSHAEELALDLRYEPALERGRAVQSRVVWEAVFRP